MGESSNPQPLGGNEMPRFGGIATFMRLPGETDPADLDVAVIGVPSEKWGEEVKAMVVREPGSEISEKDVIEFVHTQIASYKCPKSVDFIEELPRNPSGKILRRFLREPFWK